MNLSLPSLLGVRVLVVGDLMVDRYWQGAASRVSQEAPVPVVDVQRSIMQPGGAANTALNVVSMGAACTLVGVVGSDADGEALTEQLSAAGVDCDFLVVNDWPTIVKLRIVSQQQQLLRADFEQPLPAEQDGQSLASLLQAKVEHHLQAKSAATQAQCLVLQDYDKGVISHPAGYIDAARTAQVPVVVDPKFKPLTAYAGASLVKPNIHEFTRAVGESDDEGDLVDKAEALRVEARWEALVVTRGERGMLVVSENLPVSHIPARPVDVFDVTGAGDTAAAALGISTALNWAPQARAELANAASGLAVTKSGTAAVTGPELAAVISGALAGDAGIVTATQLVSEIARAKQAGQRIVFTNGCFDILHAGHVSYLAEAAALGDRLVVAINDDSSVTRLKGPGRPVNPLDRRLKVLAGLAAVDWVVGFAEDTPEALLTQLQPDVLVKGGDYDTDGVVGADIVRVYGGEVKVLGMVDDCSTTAIVEQLQKQQ